MGSFPPPQMKPLKPKPAAPLSVYTSILPLPPISFSQSTHHLCLPLCLTFSLCVRAFVILCYYPAIKLKTLNTYQIFLGSLGSLRPAGDVTTHFEFLSGCCLRQLALQGSLFDYWVGFQFYHSLFNACLA